MMGLCVQCGGRKECINNAKKEFQVVRLQRAAKIMQNKGFSTLQENVLNNDSPSWAGRAAALEESPSTSCIRYGAVWQQVRSICVSILHSSLRKAVGMDYFLLC